MTIPFTQYVLPDGHRKEGGFDRSEPIEAIARELLAEGVHFDAEVLSTGHVSLTAEKDDLDDPVLAIRVIRNDERVGLAVDQLVADASLMLAVRTSPSKNP